MRTIINTAIALATALVVLTACDESIAGATQSNQVVIFDGVDPTVRPISALVRQNSGGRLISNR